MGRPSSEAAKGPEEREQEWAVFPLFACLGSQQHAPAGEWVFVSAVRPLGNWLQAPQMSPPKDSGMYYSAQSWLLAQGARRSGGMQQNKACSTSESTAAILDELMAD